LRPNDGSAYADSLCAQPFNLDSITTSAGTFPLALNLDGWSTAGGTATVVPFGALGAPISGFPTTGDQWLVVGAGTTGAGIVPAGGPMPAGAPTGNVKAPMPIPSISGLAITFDWTYVTPECPNDPTYNDFMQVSLKDAAGIVLQVLLYQDTFSTNYDTINALSPSAAGTVPLGFCTLTLEVAPAGAVKTAVVTVDPLLLGNTNVFFAVDVGNGTDTAYASHCYIDSVNFAIGGPSVPTIALSAPIPGLTLILSTGLNVGWDTFNVLSIEPCPGGPGMGPASYLGLCATNATSLNFLIQQVTTPSVPGNPFHFPATSITEAFGPFVVSAGIQVDAICFQINPSTGLPVAGPVINYTSQ
jgi:hypothetical protein